MPPRLKQVFLYCISWDKTKVGCSFMQGGKFDAKSLLGYCYYAGMIYTALKKFEKALYFYEVVCTSRETP